MPYLSLEYNQRLWCHILCLGLMKTPHKAVLVHSKHVTQQRDTNLCGVMAVAFVTELLFGRDPCARSYDLTQMRNHLATCFSNKELQPFPAQHCSIKPNFWESAFEVYCICRMPHHKEYLKVLKYEMAQCETCKEWFHRGCESIPTSLFDKEVSSLVSWSCSNCRPFKTLMF